jgi:hypothetical protein
MQYAPFRDTTVLVCGFPPADCDALVGSVQTMGGNTQTRFHSKALPHVVVCGSTLDEHYRVSLHAGVWSRTWDRLAPPRLRVQTPLFRKRERMLCTVPPRPSCA